MPLTVAPTPRLVTAADIPDVLALVREVLAEFDLSFGDGSPTDLDLANLPASYEARGGAFWVVPTISGELLGTCGVFPVGDGKYELRKMYLRAAARGLRLGQTLLDLAIAWTRAQGGKRMVLDTTDQMVRAIAFYEKNGFVRDDREIHAARCSRGYSRDL